MSIHPISENAFNELIEVLERFIKLNHKFKLELKGVLFETTYNKRVRILSAKSQQDMAWFMLVGLSREIRIHKETFEENTVWFWFAKDFIYTTPGFFSREPSESTVEVLEDSKVVLISYENWTIMKNTFPEMEILTEKIRAEYDKMRSLHADDIKNLSTDERYLKLEKTLDILFGRTQLRFIAEYLGMSPDTLGKLRKKYSGRR
ncbi:cAMP-binding domain of CRP or a regulatory subunit of cAMP-dependent protein kinases [Pedobacter steynii]|uniref:cAMP-binding domain of CRP or a regulatory subunit of cAMP-dependent protein kinases n=1 Tax=Pedobacter steynii TaxID=430522 RepID=A0A1G9P6Q8_9SPHI|nr:hypothetical protein [Pedobacter steynii]NQX39077.1 hypothetical protein [Pedobacter steynii]SDL94419.1 cAMP-binding domain of CRP or a regulatory subunit of cAMP-dependent protein kinases [Pedobacter steynii]